MQLSETQKTMLIIGGLVIAGFVLYDFTNQASANISSGFSNAETAIGIGGGVGLVVLALLLAPVGA